MIFNHIKYKWQNNNNLEITVNILLSIKGDSFPCMYMYWIHTYIYIHIYIYYKKNYLCILFYFELIKVIRYKIT